MGRPTRSARAIGRLHVIISDRLGEVTGGRPRLSGVELAAEALRGGADTIQYRRKVGEPGEWLEEGRAIHDLCLAEGVPLIVNDHIELCLELDAEGLHLGLNDLPIAEGRRILGPAKLIGGTARTIEHIRAAAESGADYVGFGPVWATDSKEISDPVRGLEHLRSVAAESPIPVIAIGGINLQRAGQAIAAGAYGIAVIGAISNAEDPFEVTQQLASILQI